MSLVDYQSSSEESDGEKIEEHPCSLKKSVIPSSKRKEHVKISLPSLDQVEDDVEDEGERTPKKLKVDKSSGLLSMLPPPKYSRSISKVTSLVPHTVSKKKSTDVCSNERKGLFAPKSVERDDEKRFDKSSTCNYFSLTNNVSSTSSILNETTAFPSASDFKTKYEDETPIDSQEPLPCHSKLSTQEYETGMPSNSEIDVSSHVLTSVEEPTRPETDLQEHLNDKRFFQLHGKKMQGLEDINIIDISADSLVSDRSEWHLKSVSEEKKSTLSRRKGCMPTQVQKRKHQITYLAFQAQERELDLKNQWAQNKLTKQQTQSKYGF